MTQDIRNNKSPTCGASRTHPMVLLKEQLLCPPPTILEGNQAEGLCLLEVMMTESIPLDACINQIISSVMEYTALHPVKERAHSHCITLLELP